MISSYSSAPKIWWVLQKPANEVHCFRWKLFLENLDKNRKLWGTRGIMRNMWFNFFPGLIHDTDLPFCMSTMHETEAVVQTKQPCIDFVWQTWYTDYLVPWMSLNLWELELCVVRIHALDLFPCWSTQDLHGTTTEHVIIKNTSHGENSLGCHTRFHLDNLNQLINSTFPGKKRLHQWRLWEQS
jgi:hypothetical protein